MAEKKVEETNKDVFKYSLEEAVEFEGKEYKDLVFDFGKLTGRDALSIEEELEAQNIYAVAPETSRAYQTRMAARAGDIPAALLEVLNFKDFNRIANAARNFLVGQAL